MRHDMGHVMCVAKMVCGGHLEILDCEYSMAEALIMDNAPYAC